ncbi:hypothetical protein VE01_07392 [Pseudogymnoascus verrucosus]|uniref:Uncharacterized protein n=1 Tax=Pseudogymnoascus verrucosus TaxID=342668 RepID=A0A1B8GH00_9PEZI|nr:uncharacterized protein VE01_07392 [Pseudogymnoascus verrucosus]OBT95090.1 hypothetical protein VE01_07392 [Pseudogymnoascus verrucosus]
MPQPQGTTEPTTKPQQGSHRPILPVARKPGTPEASNAILYGATSRDTIAIRSSQGGVASIQSLSASLLTSPSNSRVDAVSKSITITVTSAAALTVTSTEKAVLYALVLDRGAPENFHSGYERINPWTSSLSSNRAELSV